jgi:hypothetical protein
MLGQTALFGGFQVRMQDIGTRKRLGCIMRGAGTRFKRCIFFVVR